MATDAPARPRRVRCALALLLVPLLAGHIGDNNTHFRGAAGPYDVQVVVRHPGVVPGLAGITIRVENGPVRSVTVRPVRFDVGVEGSPRPDPATPVADDPGLYTAELWFMTTGSYSVHVTVDGAAGSGTAIVPVASLATETLGMSIGLGAVLVLLAILLIAGLLTIVRAATTEAVAAPGEPISRDRRRRGRRAVAIAACACALVLLGGRRWWSAEQSAYASLIFEPRTMKATVADSAGLQLVSIAMPPDRSGSRGAGRIVPDHGKLMHAFLVRLPSADAFAHVHPERTAPGRFRLIAPPVPAGRYRMYADVVHESGFAETLIGQLDLSAPADSLTTVAAQRDHDDAWWVEPPEAGSVPDILRIDDQTEVRWLRPTTVTADEEIEFAFDVRRPWGAPVPLEPYMGMPSHAVVRRDDGSVFVHLHANGSVSMAAQRQLADGAASDHVGMPHMMDAAMATGEIRIPYSFPRPGRYRIWIQFKVDGDVRTAAFDAEVVGG